MRSRQTYGSPRLARVLGLSGKAQPHRQAHALREALRSTAIRVSSRQPPTAATADPMRLSTSRGLAVQRLDQVWATEGTCVLTGQGWLYLVAVLDFVLPPRRRLCHESNPNATLVIAALRVALIPRSPGRPLIVHFDSGAQFASAASANLGQTRSSHLHGIAKEKATTTPSSKRIGAASNKNSFAIICFATLAEVRTAIFDYIETF